MLNKFSLTVLFLLLAGCAPSQPEKIQDGASSYASLPTHWPLYHVAFFNKTGTQLHEVRFEFELTKSRYVCNAGELAPESEADDGGAPDPMPAAGEVIWRTADGVEHRQNVFMAAYVKHPRAFDGAIYLKISNSGVSVAPVTQAEARARIDDGLSPMP